MVNSNVNALGVIFANTYDNLVPELVAERSMASIPFGGRYRLIDFTLSSMANAGIDNVSVIVRKNYHSLMDHLGAGREWDLTRKRGGLNIVPPFAERSVKLYSGRVDALDSILNWLEAQKERYVILSDSYIAMNFDFGKLIDAQIAAGVDAVCVCGTTGESATMSIREHIAAVEFCVKRVDHRVKVIAGTGSNDTSAAVYLSQHAQDSGADACLLVTPYYNKASQTGLIKHYEYIADRVELPIILYNVPSRTGVSFTAESYKILSENPRFNGVKEASGNFSLLAHTRFLCPDDFYIWSGNDDQVVPMMSLGAKGVISVASNIIPEVMVKMSHLCLEGQFEDASKLQIAYMDLIDALFIEVNPIPIKAALRLSGLDVGHCRLPLTDPTPEHLELLKQMVGATVRTEPQENHTDPGTP